MFNRVSMTRNDKDNTYTFTGNLGNNFGFAVRKIGYNDAKQKSLFIRLVQGSLTIHSFFITDLYFICEVIIERGFEYDVNMKAIHSLMNVIDEQIIGAYRAKHKLDMDAIKQTMKYQPLKQQEHVYESYLKVTSMNGSRGMLLDAGVGTGKTYMSLSLSVALHSDVVLVIAPLPTIERVWVESLSGKGCLYKHKQPYYNVNSSEPYKGEKYVIAHYEAMDKVIPLYEEYNLNMDTIIVDEVHNFNTLNSERTKTLIKITDTIPFTHAIPMSGTPIKASPKDMIPLLKIISADFTDVIMRRFLKVYKGRSAIMEHVLSERYSDYTVSVKKSNSDMQPVTTRVAKIKIKNGSYYTLEAISKRLIKYVDDRTKELTKQLPMYTTRYNDLYARAKLVLIDTGQLKEDDFVDYDHNIEVILGAYKHGRLTQVGDEIRDANLFERKYIEPVLNSQEKVLFRDAKTVYKYLDLKVRGEALANVVMKAREDCYSELAANGKMLKGFINGAAKKTLIFSQYTRVCDSARDTAAQLKFKPITVYGDTSKDLTRNVNIFINREDVNPLISTYKSLSTGVPLIVANVVVMYGLPYRQYQFDQTVGRAWRTGQDTPVVVYIAELETGDDKNITDRDFDIIDFYRKEVSRFTGNDDVIAIDRGESINTELGIDQFMQKQEDVFSKVLRTSNDIIKSWMR